MACSRVSTAKDCQIDPQRATVHYRRSFTGGVEPAFCGKTFFQLVQSLLRIFEQAEPEDIQTAKAAWRTYNVLTTHIALEFGFSPSIGAAVFAALSPNNDYYGNLRDTRRLLQAVRQGRTCEEVRVSTYHNNRNKAWAIATGTDPLDLIVFPKTRSFFLNICDPDDPVPVTIDGHIFNAWTGVRIPLKSAAQKLRASLYEKVAEDIREIGRRQGIIANQVQSIIWYTWRRIHSIKFSAQREFWSLEAEAAGIPFYPADQSLPEMVGMAGHDPATFWMPSRCSTS